MQSILKISVIVPNYNHAPYLKQRIDSILNQTYQDFELILLDDCSTDNSREILTEYSTHPKVSHCMFNDENSGSTFKQWDKGIELAKGEYIWIAESDDVAELGFLFTIEKAVSCQPTAGLFFTSSQLINGLGQVSYDNAANNSGEIVFYEGKQFIKEKLSTTNSIWNASMVVFKRSLYKEIDKHLFVNMKYCGDWFFYALLAEKYPVVEIKMVLNNFRVHSANVSTEAEKSGKTFSEGLIVYNYLTKYFSNIERIKYNFMWAKALFKSKLKFQIPDLVFHNILRDVKQSNQQIISFYHLYSALKNRK